MADTLSENFRPV